MADLSVGGATNTVNTASTSANLSRNTKAKLGFLLFTEELKKEIAKKKMEINRNIEATRPVDTKKEAKRLGLPENASLDEILKKQKEENAKTEAELQLFK